MKSSLLKSLLIVFLVLTSCIDQKSDYDRQVSFEEKLVRVKEASKYAAGIILESIEGSGNGKRNVSFNKERALSKVNNYFENNGYANNLSIDFDNQRPLDELLSKVAYSHYAKINQVLVDVPEKLLQGFSGDQSGRVLTENLSYEIVVALQEVETEVLSDNMLSENEKIQLAQSIYLMYEIAPGIIQNYQSQFNEGFGQPYRTKGWLKNLFKTVVNAVVTIIAYTANFMLYAATIGALITGGLDGGAVGGIVGGITGLAFGITCVANAYSNGGNGCFRCTFCVTDWVNDPCYQASCPW